MSSVVEAAVILPDVDVRRDFARLIQENLPNIRLRVLDPLVPEGDPDVIADVEALFTFGHFLTDEAVGQARKLRWIQCLGTGVDGLVDRATLGSHVWVTNARGVHGASVSETALTLMLALARDIPGLVAAQVAHNWRTGPARLLSGKTVGILGVGLIAEALARRCAAMEMRVEGISSRTEAPFFDRLRPYDQLTAAVREFDYFVLLAPLSDTTRNIVNREVLAAMKPDAILVNVARGGVVDEDALVDALRSGRPAAAGLDVFATEPLPFSSALWDLPNVLISPHTAGQHHEYARLVLPILEANWAAFQGGLERDFKNIVRAGGAAA